MLQPPISLACQPGASRTLLLALAAMRGSIIGAPKRADYGPRGADYETIYQLI